MRKKQHYLIALLTELYYLMRKPSLWFIIIKQIKISNNLIYVL